MKIVAFLCVVSWTGFWAFGYLALSSADFSTNQVAIAAVIAFAGLLSGVFSYIRLNQHFPTDYKRSHGNG